MKIPLTIHLLIKNNEQTIEHTLKSIIPLNATILIGNIGCTDDTVNICKSHKANNIVSLSLNDDLSKVRIHTGKR